MSGLCSEHQYHDPDCSLCSLLSNFKVSQVDRLLLAASNIRDRLEEIMTKDESDPLAFFGTYEDQLAFNELDEALKELEAINET